ncbi:hypothetical protein ACHAWF_003247 [Thalassiosira exigua]
MSSWTSRPAMMDALSIILLCLCATSKNPSAVAFAPARHFGGNIKCHKSITSVIYTDTEGSSHRKPSMHYNPQRTIIARAMSSSDDEKEGGDGEDAKKSINDEIFWAKQRALAAEMSAKTDAGYKQEQTENFAKRRLALVSDTLYFSVLIGALLWLVAPNPFVTISYLFGALSGTAYSYGLGKYVETIGGSIDDTDMQGAGVGQARFAFLILLFVVVGKFRSQGLLEIPSIMGFFTYQLASLGQGLREIDD